MTRICIDPNVRVRGNGTFVGYEQIDGGIVVGDIVEVYEEETGAIGQGRIAEVDALKLLVYLDVEWASLKVPPA